MTKLKINLLAFKNAPESIFNNAISRLEKLISSNNYLITEDNPDILFFLTGGSEQSAIKQVKEGVFYILIGSKHDNSYSSATEVKAALNSKTIKSVLLDEEEDTTKEFLNNFLKIKRGLNSLKNKRLGLIGEVSEWLISSTITSETLYSKLGVKLIKVPWSKIDHFSNFKVSEPFLKSFEGRGQIDLSDTARVNGMLEEVVRKWNLDAISVECFPLVHNEGVTACLPLSNFNDKGVPAGCEGDITAIIGMMLAKEIIGSIPWIANINKVTEEYCLFSHCTIAKGLVENFTVMTHFETGKGSAIAGDFKDNSVTIFRLDNTLSNAFISSSQIIDRPKSCSACRTQIKVELTKHQVYLLKEKPLGNHHLIFPGDCEKLLRTMCNVMDINIL